VARQRGFAQILGDRIFYLQGDIHAWLGGGGVNILRSAQLLNWHTTEPEAHHCYFWRWLVDGSLRGQQPVLAIKSSQFNHPLLSWLLGELPQLVEAKSKSVTRATLHKPCTKPGPRHACQHLRNLNAATERPLPGPTGHLGDKADLTPSPLLGQAATGAV